MSKIRKPQPRSVKKKRGVILLIVVSLLTLLVLIGVSYTLLANRSLISAKVEAQIHEYREPPEKMFEQVVGQVLYGPTGRSSLGGHDLMSDLYGHDHVFDDLNSELPPAPPNPLDDTKIAIVNGPVWGGQAFAFQVLPNCLQTFAPPPLGGPLSPILDYYSGRLLTFLDGPAKGYTGRILQYDPTFAGGPQFIIEVDPPFSQSFGFPVATNPFVINGAPFNGAGAGYDPHPDKLNIDAVYGNRQSIDTANPPNAPLIAPPPTDLVALLPHFAAYDPTFGRVFSRVGVAGQNAIDLPPTAGVLLAGGADESWDAPDFQNMFLAMVPPTAAVLNSDIDPTNNLPILPSYHRPELVNYWVNFMAVNIFVGQGGFVPNDAAHVDLMWRIIAQPYGANGLREPNGPPGDDPLSTGTPQVTIDMLDRVYNITRCSIFRPLPWDHQNFTGSNPALAPATPPTAANVQQVLNVLCGRDALPLFPLPPPFPQPPPSPPAPPPAVLFAPLNLYDVDNDNDGIRDSIWIDPGLPVVTAPDGKRYKRLFAIMVQDLDGRIDLNAHGNLAQIQESPPGSGQYVTRSSFQVPAGFGLITAPVYVARGGGFGPAEVDFLNVLTQGAVPTAGEYFLYRNLLQARYASNVPGPGPTQDAGVTAFPGITRARDLLDIVKHHGVPNDYTNQLSWYASPPDVWGRGAIVLDYGGHPLYSPFAAPVPAPPAELGEMIDNPYELTLGGGQHTNSDSPYTLVAIEKLLRYHDHDVRRLPSRPLEIDEQLPFADRRLTTSSPGVIGPDHTRRQRLAGITSTIPTVSGQIPLGPRIVAPNPPANPTTTSPNNTVRGVLTYSDNAGVGRSSILDLYRRRLLDGGVPPANINAEMNRIVPWEIRHGGKFDINRWLGDGFDNDGNNTVDDPAEAMHDTGNPAPFNGQRERAWQDPALLTPYPSFNVNAEHVNGVDANLDGSTGGTTVQQALDRGMARQLYARHLFCLMMLTFDNHPATGFTTGFPQENPPLQPADYRELFIRRLAQWVVNVVDFRDSDAIMTAFEYDVNPWNGWQVDGNLATNSTDGSTPLPESIDGVLVNTLAQNERRVVWGVEAPELLITETLAFHSRNVKDTDQADAGDMKRSDPNTNDDDLDQFRVPQGSLFVEVYCPRGNRWGSQLGNQKPRYPAELYTPGGQLDLARQAPGGRPIWRLAISPLIRNDGNYPERQPNQMAVNHPESATFDPQDVYFLNGGTYDGAVGPLADFRFAYFGNCGAIPPAEQVYSFDNKTSPALLERGQYAVIGPRPVTHLGSVDPVNNTPIMWGRPADGDNGYSRQRIEMNPPLGVFNVYDTNNTITTRTPGVNNIRPVLSIVANYQNTPSTGGTAWNQPWTSGLNITEPLMSIPGANYYPEPDLTLVTTNGLPMDAGFYNDPDPTIAAQNPAGFKQHPVEGTTGPAGANAGRPIFDRDMQQTGTYEEVSSVYLQRLANPNLPFNALLNPYLTVDWASLDVTVFAGDEDTDQLGSDNMPLDPDDDWATPHAKKFRSGQRGYAQDASTYNPWAPLTRNLLAPALPDTLNRNPAIPAPAPYFKIDLSNNLDNNFDIAGPDTIDRHTLGYLNGPVGYPLDTAPQNAQYPGEPFNPFPWLTWNNRPFNNPYELFMVPSSGPTRLCFEFSPGFNFGGPGSPYNNAQPYGLRSPFSHLLNFFHYDPATANSPQLERLLEFIEIPSPYAGTERWFNPANFGNAGLYRPPFNKLSRFREPGRININTIFDDQIWRAAVGDFPLMSQPAFADKVFRSRQGYGTAAAQWQPQMNAAYPTLFANPFRPLDAADLMPDVVGVPPTGLPPEAGGMRRDGQNGSSMAIDATFLRPDPDSLGAPPPNPAPLFNRISPNPYDNTDRNAYFRYQAYQKLGNTFTTHSNVFAVWMTMGYFEVEDNVQTVNGTSTVVVNAGHPDGLRLGQEIGADSGEIVRHRAFYIIDRSVPVGHAPGQKLNSENCILLRRMIE